MEHEHPLIILMNRVNVSENQKINNSLSKASQIKFKDA